MRCALAALAAQIFACAAGCGGDLCDYDRTRCPDGQLCARVDEQRAECVAVGQIDAPLRVPFADGTAFTCAQGPRGPGSRTHSFRNDLFAVDLASTGAEPGVVVAPMDGQAYVFDGCEEREPSAASKNESRCGLGYGNHVRIWDGQTMVLVAHLSRVTVKDGLVQAGQPIGLEGSSGAAGHRHVHLAVTRPGKGVDAKKMLANAGWTGHQPMRVRLTLRQEDGGAVVVRGVDELRCADDPSTRTRYWP